MYTPLNQYHVVMEVEPRFWQSPDGLRYVYLRGRNGTQVPLSAIARYAPARPAISQSSAQFPSITISFNLRREHHWGMRSRGSSGPGGDRLADDVRGIFRAPLKHFNLDRE